ncbi:MAG TPA: hypothetical protein VET85_03850 [Stellaceae bacterium]|nr:hypothetical protein [Stellaceae bacterium]
MSMFLAPQYRPPPPRRTATEIIHHVTLRHQVEIEIRPASIELWFGDERWTDPINTEQRFEATVFNSRLGATWEVRDPFGNPGAGTIDSTGLYQAPPKGGLASGTTDLVIATAVEDPLRKAFAWVTLVGKGPLPAPDPRVEVWPKRINLYHQQAGLNGYISASNKMQLFRAAVRHSANAAVEWLVDGTVQAAQPAVVVPWFLYQAPAAGSRQVVRARLAAQHDVYDEAQVILLDYSWPGL